jgi:hypothetical protein
MLLFGVLFGLLAPVFGSDPCAILAAMHDAEDPGHHHHDEDLPPCNSHDENCPQEHHHHGGICCYTTPVATDLDYSCVLFLPDSQLLRFRAEHHPVPDGPYLSSDSPPLI